MKINISGKALCTLLLALFAVFSPLYGAEARGAHIEINLIIDGSAALANVRGDVTDWVSGNLIDRCLQEGDRITVWNAGGKAEVVYSDTLKNASGKESLKKALAGISGAGNSPDFAGALQEAVSRSTAGNITFTLLVSASPAALSPILLGPNAGLMRFSRIEEFRGWRAVVIALNIDSRVRQAAASYFPLN